MTRIMARLLPETGFGRNARGFARGGEERGGLGLALALLVSRIAVGDDAGAGLDVHDAVLHHGGAQDDAGIDRAVGREVADAASVGAARLGLEFGDDLTGADFGCA